MTLSRLARRAAKAESPGRRFGRATLLLLAAAVALTAAGATTAAETPQEGATPPSAEPDRAPGTRVVILLYDGVELMDLAGPQGVFSAASEVNGGSLFEVHLAATSKDLVTSHRGIRIAPDCVLDDCPPPDLLVVPGGAGVFQAMESPEILGYVRRVAAGRARVMSVCVGAFLIARAGLLDGQRATTHELGIGYLTQLAPKTEVVSGERWVDSGEVITSGGMSAGIDAALLYVQQVAGAELARAAAHHMNYVWNPPAGEEAP